MKGLHIDSDIVERIYVMYVFIVEICRIVMGCFTSIFISHMCGENQCSLIEILFPDDITSILIIAMNFITFMILFSLFIFELYRENWLITNFDKDENLPETNLSSETRQHNDTLILYEFKTKLILLNKNYQTLSIITVFVFICNTLSTAIFILQRHNSYSTYTAFLSFTILLFQKVYYSFYISRKKICSAHSAFMTLPHTFNAIDKDMRDRTNKINPV